MVFRFRLSRVLEWYDRQYRMEANRLRQCAERSARAHAELEGHRQSRLVGENRLLTQDSLDGSDLRARELYRNWSMVRESHLIRICQDSDRAMEAQKSVTIIAQRRVRLVEKLRERKRDEFSYLASRDLEQAAADSWLAGFARNLTENKDT